MWVEIMFSLTRSLAHFKVNLGSRSKHNVVMENALLNLKRDGPSFASIRRINTSQGKHFIQEHLSPGSEEPTKLRHKLSVSHFD